MTLLDYDPLGNEVEIIGALDVAVTKDGARPSRLPREWRPRIPTTFMQAMVDSAAGVRVRFRSTATTVGIRVVVRPLEFVGISPMALAEIDLVVDGVLARSQSVGTSPARLDVALDRLECQPAEAETVLFDGLTAGDKTLELWLPQSAIVDIVAILSDQPVRRAAPPAARRWVHHGSSISHCVEALSPTATWPAIAAFELELDLLNLSFAGNAMLDPFVAQTIRDAPADVISLELGVNLVNADAMRARAFEQAVHGWLDTIRDGHPDAPLVLITPIACPTIEDTPGPTGFDPETGSLITHARQPTELDALTLNRIRSILNRVHSEREVADPALYLATGTDLFGMAEAQVHLPDGIHPDQAGYSLIAERFARWARNSSFL